MTRSSALPTSTTEDEAVGALKLKGLPLTNTTSPTVQNGTGNLQTSNGYVFNPESSSNVAVYYGQTALTGSTSLESQCASPDIDIIILAFITSRTTANKPIPNLGAACGNVDSSTVLSSQILACQNTYGKKVVLSIGGAVGGVTFSSNDDARSFAGVLWKTFGPVEGGGGNVVRPFGEMVLDGFDIDNENQQPASYLTLAQTLRAYFSSSPTKQYYLTSAPQCPFPDASNPTPMLLLCDFIFMQFYNNPSCEIGSSGFLSSLSTWSSAISSGRGMLYVGAPGWVEAGMSAYENGIQGPKGIGAVVGNGKMEFGGRFGG
ncbi:glycoside hydrolase superfamily [Amylocarpus encephaloides]|uniref:chitinase n=1 Tax=Amylocarpus encephaloides TaxID=45428 RepID=A0A9P7YMC6_9HELO|nr:glycoside hydrolase superfamily [Amylocarpus encephaloides]